jgi:hypothetical protein
LGLGGLGSGAWPQPPTPQSPIPNPQSPIPIIDKKIKKIIFILLILIFIFDNIKLEINIFNDCILYKL